MHILSNVDIEKRIGTCCICGLVNICKNGDTRFACAVKRKEYSKEYRKTEKGIKIRKSHLKTPTVRFANAKSAAKSRRKEFTLTQEEYWKEVKKPCYYCNNRLGKQVEYASGLDRLDSSKGYISGNVVSCCRICNVIKSNILTSEETKAAIEAILNIRKKNEQ